MKKLSVINKLMISSRNPGQIIKRAIEKLDRKMLTRFVLVLFDSGMLNDHSLGRLGKRSVSDQITYSLLPSLDKLDIEGAIYFSIGVARAYLDELRSFVSLESEFNSKVLSSDFEEALTLLDEIDSVVGSSKWSERNRITLKILSQNNYKYDDQSCGLRSKLVRVLLRAHSEYASEIYSGEDNFKYLFESCREQEFGSGNDWVKYQLAGVYPEVEINIADVMLSEFSGTLIDFYKAFEVLAFDRAISRECNDSTKECVKLLKDIGHEDLCLREENELDDLELGNLKIFDEYTSCRYQCAIELGLEYGGYDLGVFCVIAKSLAHEKCRLVGKSSYYKLLNMMADVFEKKKGFSKSVNKIVNYCRSFSGIRFYNNLAEIVFYEYNASLCCSSRDFRMFSNIPTGVRLALQFDSSLVVDFLEDNKKYGPVLNLLKLLEKDSSIGKSEIGSREIKYYGRKLIDSDRCSDAVELYSKSVIDSDPSISRDYMVALVRERNVLEAANIYIELCEKHSEAIGYFSITMLHDQVYKLAAKTTDICIPKTLYRYRVVEDSSKNRTATALSIRSYVKGLGLNLPSEMDLSEGYDVLFFLEYICTRDMLSKSLMFRYQSDAFDERIRICNLLSEAGVENSEKMLFEAKELSKRKVLNEAERHVSKSKVYADKDYVRTETWDIFNVACNDYKEENFDFGGVDELLEQVSSGVSEVLISQEQQGVMERINSKISPLMNISKDGKNRVFYTMIRSVLDSYCFGLKGLNGYLGTRIRHGTFETNLMIPMSESSLYFGDDFSDENDFLKEFSFTSKVIQDRARSAHRDLNAKIYGLVMGLVNENIMVSTNEKPSSKAAFNYNLNVNNVISLRKLVGDDVTEDRCWKIIFDWIDKRTEEGCVNLDKEIDDVFAIIIDSISGFEDILRELLVNEDFYKVNEILNKVSQAKRGMTPQLRLVKGWFEYDSSISSQDYDLSIVIEIVENMVGLKINHLEECKSVMVPNSLLSCLVDVLYNVVGNAIKHSSCDRNEISLDFTMADGESITKLEVKNSTKYMGDIDAENKRLKSFVVDKDINDIKSLIQGIGGTGVARIMGVLKHDLKSEAKVNMEYENPNMFLTSIEISKECGIEFI